VTPPISEIAQQRTVRLIPTAYDKPPVLRALVETAEDLAILEQLEAQALSFLQSKKKTLGAYGAHDA